MTWLPELALIRYGGGRPIPAGRNLHASGKEQRYKERWVEKQLEKTAPLKISVGTPHHGPRGAHNMVLVKTRKCKSLSKGSIRAIQKDYVGAITILCLVLVVVLEKWRLDNLSKKHYLMQGAKVQVGQ